MLFSIIVPTYNPRTFLPGLLESISHNECIDEIEIIISDDCSTEPFEDILQLYNNLNIRTITNEKHMGFPRDGRQHGAQEAKGEWICFADQDDYFLDKAFDKVKLFIQKNNCYNYIISNFIRCDEVTRQTVLEDGTQGWTHGKFYEKVFWDKYKLGYDDVRYCEDINLSTKVGCLICAENITPFRIEEPIYVWHAHKDSLSDDEYYLNSFPDYIKSTLGIVIEYVEKYKEIKDYQILFLQTFLHMYFYLQGPLFIGRKKLVLEIILLLIPIYERFKSIMNYTTNDILNLLSTDWSLLYAETRNNDYKQIPFTEQLTFKQWLEVYFD